MLCYITFEVRGRMAKEARAEWRPAVGEAVDSYHLEEKLGEGGFGSVYRARRGGRLYAVKFLSLKATDDWGGGNWRCCCVRTRRAPWGRGADASCQYLEGHGGVSRNWPGA